MEIECRFRYTTFSDDKSYYSCVIKNQVIPDNCELILTGQHKYGKTNKDVIYVEFGRCTITKVPRGLKRIFPNMTMLWFCGGQIKKLSKDDFVEYRNLERFHCSKNEVEFLPGDLFEDTRNLDWICIEENKLKVVEPNILEGLDKLIYVSVQNLPEFSECFTVEDPQGLSLAGLKRNLMQKYVNYSRSLKNSEEELRNEVQQLKDAKADLEQQNASIKEINANLQSELEQEKLKNSQLLVVPQNKFLDDLKAFSQDETTKDFKIIIEDQEFPVHKFILAARSPTLAELFKANPAIENLNLVDISVEIFDKILKFLYTDELPGDDGTNFLHLFAAAGKLKIQELKELSATKLIDRFKKNNVLEIFKLSNKYEHEELRKEAFAKLKAYYQNYKFKDEWIARPEVVEKAIEQYKKAEDEIRKLENDFVNVNVEN
ncbi:hypothetical protein ACKWTF_015219 [Chironomus riparius]